MKLSEQHFECYINKYAEIKLGNQEICEPVK